MASACGTGQSENRRFCALRNLSYTTRANISHEKTEQIRARIACTPAINAGRGLTHMRSMCVGVAETGHRGEVPALTGWKENFLFCLLVVFGFYIVGELTHMRSMCVGVAETGGEHCSPAMIHKSPFPVLLPWLVFSTLSRTFSPWRKFSLRGQGWRHPFSCASSSFRIARLVYSCECLNPARDNPASAR